MCFPVLQLHLPAEVIMNSALMADTGLLQQLPGMQGGSCSTSCSCCCGCCPGSKPSQLFVSKVPLVNPLTYVSAATQLCSGPGGLACDGHLTCKVCSLSLSSGLSLSLPATRSYMKRSMIEGHAWTYVHATATRVRMHRCQVTLLASVPTPAACSSTSSLACRSGTLAPCSLLSVLAPMSGV
jgi:hypothetical protein